MASFEDIIAALKGGKSQPDAMPFGVGGPAEPVHEPTNIINPLVGSLAQKTMDVPKHLIDAAHQFDPNDIHGSTARVVPAATDAAMGLMGRGVAAPKAGSVGVFGGDLFKKKAKEIRDALAADHAEALRVYNQDVWNNHPSSAAARIAEGYTTPAYRGVSDYTGSGVNPIHAKADAGSSAMYSTASPMLADMYSSYLSKHPGWKPESGSFGLGSSVMPLKLNTNDYHYVNAKGKHWTDANAGAINEAKDLGKPGVIIDNVWDEPVSTTNLSSPQKIFVTFPEGAATAKSKFASKFDPTDPNMLHGAGLGVAPAASVVDALRDKKEKK